MYDFDWSLWGMLVLQCRLYFVHIGSECFVHFSQFANGLAGMEHGSVVFSSDERTYLRGRIIRVVLGQVHGYLACLYYIPFSGFGVNHRRLQSVMGAYGVDDVVYRDRFGFVAAYLLHDSLCQIKIHFFVIDSGMGHDGDDDTFQVTHAVADILSDVVDDLRRELQAVTSDFVTQDVAAELDGGLFQFGHHAPLETRNQSFFHALQQGGRAVGSKDELLAVLVQVVEDVEEVVLGLGESRKFLYVVNNQDIDALVEVNEIVRGVVAHRIGVLHLE